MQFTLKKLLKLGLGDELAVVYLDWIEYVVVKNNSYEVFSICMTLVNVLLQYHMLCNYITKER